MFLRMFCHWKANLVRQKCCMAVICTIILFFSMPIYAIPYASSQDYMVYRTTEADLSILDDYIEKLSSEKIDVSIKSVLVNSNNSEYDWINAEIDDQMDIIYLWYKNGEHDRFILSLSRGCQFKDEAFEILLTHLLPIEREEARDYLAELQKKIIDEYSESSFENGIIGYSENAYTQTIDIERSNLLQDPSAVIKEQGWSDEEADDNTEHIEIVVSDQPFSSELNAVFSVYETIAEAGRQLGYVVQNNNPEISFDGDFQSVGIMRIYVTYFAQCTKEEAKATLEYYTDELIYAITETYPNVTFDNLSICWEVPAIDENNLYAARYRCENKDGTIIRGSGEGIIYN